MTQRVTSPDGVAYQVALDWAGRKVRNPVTLSRGRAAGAWRRHPMRRWVRRSDQADSQQAAAARPGEPAKSRWWDSFDCCAPECGDLDDVAALPVLAVVGVLLVVLGLALGAPLVVAVVAVLVEFFYLVLAAGVVLVWRVVWRRPWRVVAVSAAGGTWQTDVVGWRSARAMVRTVASGLAAGSAPVVLGLRATDRRSDDWIDPADGEGGSTTGTP